MKKILMMAVLAMAVSFSASAQKWFIGGELGFWTGKDNGTKTTMFKVAPEVGYNINSNWTIAASVGYFSYSEKTGGVKNDSDGFIIKPYIRYSFLKKGILTAFVDGGADFGLSDIKGFQAGLRPGVAVAITDRFCAVAHFGFLGYSDGKSEIVADKGFGLDLSGYQSTLGFYYSF